MNSLHERLTHGGYDQVAFGIILRRVAGNIGVLCVSSADQLQVIIQLPKWMRNLCGELGASLSSVRFGLVRVGIPKAQAVIVSVFCVPPERSASTGTHKLQGQRDVGITFVQNAEGTVSL